MKSLLGFLVRRGAVYVLLVVALLAYQARGIVAEPLRQQRNADALESVAGVLEAAQVQARDEVTAAREEARGRTVAELESQLTRAREDLRRREEARRRNAQAFVLRSPLNPRFALSDGEWALKVQAAQYRVDGLTAVITAAEGDLSGRTALVEAASKASHQAYADCAAARRQVQDFDRQPWIGREWANLTTQARSDLVARQRRACDAYAQRQSHVNALRQTLGAARAAAVDLSVWRNREIADRAAEVREIIAQERRAAEGSFVGRAKRTWRDLGVSRVLLTAFGILVAGMLTPYAVRTLLYYVVAPVAVRRGVIRLRAPTGATAKVVPSGRSGPSVEIGIGGGEELLVRQGYLQTTTVGGAKRTRILLDWRHPLTSWATGLVGLTSIRGDEQVTTVSATHDPFAEVAVLTVPDGGALVLHPRALVAVVQLQDRPLRITAHWRLHSLDAWLTLQLRYFVFHGPSRLVIRGGRGVRVEHARRGRIFGQEQLVGFSADLGYSVARTETFLPYLFGRESLLKDRVDEGSGVLIVEESPLALRGGAQAKHGLEGAFDAALKAFGV